MSGAFGLVHNPELFDSRAWLKITNSAGWPAYAALAVELEAKPRDNRAYEPGATVAKKVVVRDGKTPEIGLIEYASMTQAVKRHGRRVRSSLVSGRTVRGLLAWLA